MERLRLKQPLPCHQDWTGFGLLQGALGLAGVEGTFRLTCEAMLACLRRNAQALELLLEAILLDPLVDWVPSREDAAANQAKPEHHSAAFKTVIMPSI